MLYPLAEADPQPPWPFEEKTLPPSPPPTSPPIPSYSPQVHTMTLAPPSQPTACFDARPDELEDRRRR